MIINNFKRKKKQKTDRIWCFSLSDLRSGEANSREVTRERRGEEEENEKKMDAALFIFF